MTTYSSERSAMEMIGLTHTSHLWLFFLLVFGIIILPGMDMAFVAASALIGGRSAGLAAIAGIVVGGMVHVLLSAIGIGLILKSVPQLFDAMLMAGMLYIAWIGWTLLRSKSGLNQNEVSAQEDKPRSLMATFGQAVLTCLLNPKAYIFMLAVFPQFVRLEYGSIIAQSIVLGAIILVTQILIYGAVALLAARMSVQLQGNKDATQQIYLSRAVGILLIAVAAWSTWKGWHFS
jgi:threonine/homoserine/homoserine lactone efflux protein